MIMKHRTLALCLALTLCLSLLAGCGGSPSSSQSSGSGNSSQSQSDASTPDGSQSGDGSDTGDGSQTGDASQEQTGSLTLNRTDFSLFSVGSTFRLKASVTGDNSEITWTSSNDKVASVDEDGTVTYVSAGSATITATTADGLTATCKVYCKAEGEDENSGSGSQGGSSSSQGGGSSASQSVDLQAFYDEMASTYSFQTQMLSDDLIEGVYPGLLDIPANQCLPYANMITMNTSELALVEVANSSDVDKVKTIFQTRIDNMAQGGAFYPQAVEIWTNNARVVSNGNYVMMVVSENCDAVVDAFNALF